MSRAIESVRPAERAPLAEGCRRALDLLEGFWLGLERRPVPVEALF